MSHDPYARRAKHIMSKVVVTAGPDDTVQEAVSMMQDNRISALPVTDGRDRCVGILTATDLIDITRELDAGLNDLSQVSDVSRQWLLEALSQHDLGRQKVADRMTGAVASVGPETALPAAAREMLRHRVHHLPVMDDQQRLLGILSTMDVLDAFVEGAPVE